MADEEENLEGAPTEDQPVAEEEAVQGAEFVPEVVSKPKSDVYSAMLVLAFLAFAIGIYLAGNELHEFYDVQFWVFTKK